MINIVSLILATKDDYVYTILRIAAGVIIFPYGMQKALGWFGRLPGVMGVEKTLIEMRQLHVPDLVTWLIIIGQSLGRVALILGLFTRVAAVGNSRSW